MQETASRSRLIFPSSRAFAPRLGLFVLLVATLAGSPAAGQRALESCRDREDRPVARVTDNAITYAGLAAHRHGRPVIIWNARVNGRLSFVERTYIYLHECAHHRLGHLEQLANDLRWEVEADCWAVQAMVDGGLIGRRHLRQLEQSRATSRGDATHLGGEAHARSLRACLEVRTDRQAWAAALAAMRRAARDGFAGVRGRVLDSLGGVPVHESLVDAPGTFDCQVAGRAIRCMVLESKTPGRARKHYERLVRLVRAWLPPDWTALERRRGDRTADSFLARDQESGVTLSLARHRGRVELLVRGADREPGDGLEPRTAGLD